MLPKGEALLSSVRINKPNLVLLEVCFWWFLTGAYRHTLFKMYWYIEVEVKNIVSEQKASLSLSDEKSGASLIFVPFK